MTTRLVCLQNELRDASRAPSELRHAVVSAVAELVGANTAVFYSVDERQRASEPVFVGSDSMPAAQQAQRRSAPWRDFSRPRRTWHRGFTLLDQIAPGGRRAVEESAIWQSVCAPFGVTDQLALLVYDGPRCVGWLGALRFKHEPMFSARHARRLQPLVATLAAALVAADRTERAAVTEEGADLVLDGNGKLLLATQAGLNWLELTRSAPLLQRWTKSIERTGSHIRQVGSTQLNWTRLHGASGVRYLLHVAPLGNVALREDSALSLRQREVARLAANGMTSSEIAAVLGRSTETVRSHLREAYQRLGVGSRGELAAALAGGAK